MAFHRVTMSQLCQARVMQNVLCIEDPGGTVTQDNIAAAILNFWIPVVKVVQWNQTQWVEIIVSQMFVGPTPPTHKMSINVVGTGGTSKAMGWSAWKLRFQTGLAGRTQRGRYFIAGIAQGPIDLTAETIGSTSIATFNAIVQNVMTNWVTGGSALGLKLCIAHKNGSTPTRVSQVTYDNFLCQMRSRKFGVGF